MEPRRRQSPIGAGSRPSRTQSSGSSVRAGRSVNQPSVSRTRQGASAPDQSRPRSAAIAKRGPSESSAAGRTAPLTTSAASSLRPVGDHHGHRLAVPHRGMRRSHGALAVVIVRSSSTPCARNSARSHALNINPAGSRGTQHRARPRTRRSGSPPPTRSGATRGSAARSGSSFSASTLTPYRRAAAGDSITTAAASSCAPTRRSESGVTSSTSRGVNSGRSAREPRRCDRPPGR